MKPIFLVLFFFSLIDPASAQSRFMCRLSNGSTVISDRPCERSAAERTTGMTSYGPIARPAQQTYIPRSGDAPEYLQFMSSQCSAMNDALRTGPARGVDFQTQAVLQKSYRAECSEDEQQAQSRLYAQKQESRNAKKEESNQLQAMRQRTQEQQQQCDESKQIIYKKSRRTDLTDGEKAELVRFKENFQTRCG
jgi:hypothetical protein